MFMRSEFMLRMILFVQLKLRNIFNSLTRLIIWKISKVKIEIVVSLFFILSCLQTFLLFFVVVVVAVVKEKKAQKKFTYYIHVSQVTL